MTPSVECRVTKPLPSSSRSGQPGTQTKHFLHGSLPREFFMFSVPWSHLLLFWHMLIWRAFLWLQKKFEDGREQAFPMPAHSSWGQKVLHTTEHPVRRRESGGDWKTWTFQGTKDALVAFWRLIHPCAKVFRNSELIKRKGMCVKIGQLPGEKKFVWVSYLHEVW